MKMPDFDPAERAKNLIDTLTAKLAERQHLLSEATGQFEDLLAGDEADPKYVDKARIALAGLHKEIAETQLAIQGAQRRLAAARGASSANKRRLAWRDTKRLLRERIAAAETLRQHADGMVAALRDVQRLGAAVLNAAPLESNAWNGTQELFYADRSAMVLKLYLSAQGTDCGLHLMPVLNAPAVRDPAFEVKELAEFLLAIEVQEKDAA